MADPTTKPIDVDIPAAPADTKLGCIPFFFSVESCPEDVANPPELAGALRRVRVHYKPPGENAITEEAVGPKACGDLLAKIGVTIA